MREAEEAINQMADGMAMLRTRDGVMQGLMDADQVAVIAALTTGRKGRVYVLQE